MNNNQQQQHQEQFQQNMQTGSGLTRYRSAPSSYFASLLDNPTNDNVFGTDDFDHLFNPRASSPETQRIFSRFMNNPDTIQENSQFLPPTKHEPEVQQLQRQQSNDYSSASHVIYQNHNTEPANSAAMDNSYNRLLGSFNSNHEVKMEFGSGGGGGNSSLIRHQSSPAGLFANIDIESEFGSMRGMGNFSSASTFKNQMDFPSSSRTMDSISEIGSKGIVENNRGHDGQFSEDNPGFTISSWDDSSILSDNYLKVLGDNANSSDDQNKEGGNRRLAHHLSLPNTSSELSAMEKLLQDSVPCKIRAKRGFATHPRSIAERVRRTKISDRMKKLQELVPNMEKQTNTSDMLELAVDYIKDLQKEVKTLSDKRAKCSCSAKHEP